MPKPIAKAGSPFWHFDFRRGGRRFHGSTGTKSKRAAQAFIDRKLAEIASGEADRKAAEKPRLTVTEVLGSYWTDHAGTLPSAATTWSQMNAITAHLPDARIPAADLSDAAVTAYQRARRAMVSDSTVNRETQCLRRALNWCVRRRGIEAPKIDWPGLALKEPKVRTRWLSEDEERRLLDALREDFRPLFLFCLWTGVRVAGARTLTWDRVDLGAAVARIEKKGGGFQDVPLTVGLVTLIANQPRACAEVFTYLSRGKARRRFTKDGWRKPWYAALEQAGVEDFRWHDLRHTAATRWRRQGADLALVMDMLGHASIASTVRYAHVGPDEARAMMEKVAKG